MVINYKNLAKRSFLRKYFEILNTAQPNPDKILTTAEIDLLIEFLVLPEKFKYQRFSTHSRIKVSEILKAKNKSHSRQSINNKIYALIVKDVIKKDTDGVLYIKDYILQGVSKGLEAYEKAGEYNLTFKFTYDTKGH